MIRSSIQEYTCYTPSYVHRYICRFVDLFPATDKDLYPPKVFLEKLLPLNNKYVIITSNNKSSIIISNK